MVDSALLPTAGATRGAGAGVPIAQLATPCLLIDLDRMEANIQRWQATIAAAGTALRPHVKTHKVPELARLQLAAGAAGKIGRASCRERV